MAQLRTTLVDTAQALLDLVVAAAAEHGVTLPARRYLSDGAAGNEAWDCEQVTVALAQLESANATLAGDQVSRTGVPSGGVSLPTAVLQVEIVRCSSAFDDREDGSAPTAQAKGAEGRVALQDAQLLHLVRARILQGKLTEDGVGTDARVGAIVPVGPEGGLASMRLLVAVTLAGAPAPAP